MVKLYAPRILGNLVDRGVHVRCKRVSRLATEAGLADTSHRIMALTTRGDPDAPPAPGPVEPDFRADGQDRLWVADITLVPI